MNSEVDYPKGGMYAYKSITYVCHIMVISHYNNTGLVASRIAQSKKRARHSEDGHQRQICPHCDQSLCSKTFKKHKRLYEKADGTWVSDTGGGSSICMLLLMLAGTQSNDESYPLYPTLQPCWGSQLPAEHCKDSVPTPCHMLLLLMCPMLMMLLSPSQAFLSLSTPAYGQQL